MIQPQDLFKLNDPLSESWQTKLFSLQQYFLDQRDYIGLRKYFSSLAEVAHLPHYWNMIQGISSDSFETELRQVFLKVRSIVSETEAEAIYFEWERSSASTTFFVFASYDPDNPDWATEFTDSLDGPEIDFALNEAFEETFLSIEDARKQGLPLDPNIEKCLKSEDVLNIEISPFHDDIIQVYFDAVLLSALGSLWSELGPANLVVGAAEHDHPILFLNH